MVDVPAHTKTETYTEEVWVEEVGHTELVLVSTNPIYRCNGCGAEYPSAQAVNQHMDDTFDWETMTGCSSYTFMGDNATYEEQWVVDTPGHYETVEKTRDVEVAEQGHWEYK